MADDIKNGKVISFMNMKGGVGKTTLCLSLGEYLANHMEYSVLLIDLDPQFNMTQTFLNETKKIDQYLLKEKSSEELKDLKKNGENVELLPTIYELFEPKKNFKISSGPCLIKSEQVIDHVSDYLDIVYGDLNTIQLVSDERYKLAISKFIRDNKLKEKYDFIFLDCPPTISLYTSAALRASDYYLIPNKLDRYSIMGIKLIKQSIALENERIMNPLEIKPLGIVYTMFETKQTKQAENLQRTFEKSSISEDMYIFTSKILQTGFLSGKKTNIMSKNSTTLSMIKEVSEEFLKRLGGVEKNGG